MQCKNKIFKKFSIATVVFVSIFWSASDFVSAVTTTSEVNISAEVVAPSGGGGGGGGGGGASSAEISVIFTGRAYPKSVVTLLKDAQIAATTITGTDANFVITLSGLSGGNFIFGVYSEDKRGLRSALLTFPVSVTRGATIKVSGIFVAPIIDVNKIEVKRGDNLAIFGQSASHADIVIVVSSEDEIFAKTISDKDGIYLYNFDTIQLEAGQHFAKSKASIGNLEISSFSKSVGFRVGTQNIFKEKSRFLKGDLNNDGRVNLIDFSIAAFWHNRPLSAEFATLEAEHLNADRKINLVDFSIMAFHWTG